MYVPSFESILRAIGTDRTAFQDSTKVTIPVELFKFLLQTTLVSCDLNEAGYLTANPDVAEALNSGSVDSVRLHYVGFGYFEGRKGAMPKVDDPWYLTTYSDVATAVKTGKVSSAAEHFEIIGAAEGRSPSASHKAIAAQ